MRTEIEEYCRLCIRDADYENDGIHGLVTDRAIMEAKRIVAEKAAARGLDTAEFDLKRRDHLAAVKKKNDGTRRQGLSSGIKMGTGDENGGANTHLQIGS